ncbi:hypothetical protein [Porphyrobacter sp. ULC335]|uniref:hypothetical protein n=1 Tax=Porphyrobacter sp. ULC335 TaxID=2854260 RepID=UPI0022200EC4|nr:hypothetical protein [Porphyrobacter sp. ULC335]UYV15709.1 hypothetical protein KVF90_16840 [Porphyrobacter sp. ULC335]
MSALRIRSSGVRWGVAALALSALSPLSANDELPTRTDIPEDLGGVVLCSDINTATRMLREYFVANANGRLDLGMFFKGLEVTGCVQTSGPLEISSVVERRDIASGGEGPFMLFAAHRPSGEQVIGIIDEASNNRHPRNDFERWLYLHAPDGTLTIESGEKRAYVCSDRAAAARVIAAIPPVRRPGERNGHQITAFQTAITQGKCRPAAGRFRVNAVHGSAFISLGYEAGAEWTALTVTDAQGREQAMVFDASLL